MLGCFAFLPKTQALNPPPDGCYPGFTTAEGCNALQSPHQRGRKYRTWLVCVVWDYHRQFQHRRWRRSTDPQQCGFQHGSGTAALLLNTAGTGNSALGTAAMVNNDNGTNNTAVGAFALQTNTNGSNNTAVGNAALQNSTGDFNTAVGANAGTDPDIVSNNVYIGDPGFAGDENVISIGGIAASGTRLRKHVYRRHLRAAVNTGTALPVYVDTDGHLGTTPANASGQKVRIRSPQGAQPQATLNEFQKQQKRIAELEATVARLAATVKDQAAQIEKVSAQLELRKPARRVVVNKQ